MVQTRRQSGKLPNPNLTSLDEAFDDDSEVDVPVQPLGLIPESKRTKVHDHEFGKRRKRKRRVDPTKGKLSILPTMPLDVLFEVFGHLTPQDLLALSSTSRLLRTTLLSKGAMSVWKTSLSKMPSNPPECPKDTTGPRWAQLLYGPNSCHNYPEFDPLITELIPYTDRSGWGGSRRRVYPPSHKLHNKHTSKFFLESDIFSMAQTLGSFTKDVHMRKAGSKGRLEEFKKMRKEFVASMVEYAKVCEKWGVDDSWKVVMERQQESYARRNEILARFVALGHDKVDVDQLSWYDTGGTHKELSQRGWALMCPRLERTLNDRKAMRIRAHRAGILALRTNVVRSLYSNYQTSQIPHREWAYLPGSEEVMEWKEFKEIIESDSEVNVSNESFDNVMERMSELIVEWRERRERELVEMLPDAESERTQANSQDGGPSTDQIPQVDGSRLELATSIFYCTRLYCPSNSPSPYPLMTIPQILSHCCQPIFYGKQTPEPVVFWNRGSEVAKGLVEAVGGDARRMTARDVDQKDGRFICVHCRPFESLHFKEDEEEDAEDIGLGGGQLVRVETFGWRDCMSHFFARHRELPLNKHAPDFALLTPVLTEKLKISEASKAAPLHPARWICTLCLGPTRMWGSAYVIENHISIQHGVQNPVEDEHYIPDARRWRTER
ncbi:hypothetical protein JAAARDRAFT_199635 [Jaapia argillacea MUCL 33604]|uniref:F-box domain-containing protein n=1 Tax=Jaapia argillacea MUCL 33604 TaxID=933084 RepID=A0A067PAC6_9AGAM|nr:hypothetical protein JAAARDRAFT_199635 [Jaapia argillacea MUCL 33604]